MTQAHTIPLCGLFVTILVLLWSMFSPYDRLTWWMEVMPVLIAYPLLIATYRKFRLTDLLYGLIVVHAVILIIGAHYTYARVPGVEWLGEGRNNYDKIGHFAQGFIPAVVIRELLLRTSPLSSGKWLFAIVVFACLGISAVYELIEWGAAVLYQKGADEFLGSQGDIWDTQKDMAFAGLGAICALLLLSKFHDRQLLRIARP